MRFRVVAILIPLALAGCHVLDAPAVLGDGPYVGVVGGGAVDIFDLPSGLDSQSTYTYGVRGGYRFLRQAAIELCYEEVGAADIELDFPQLDVGEVRASTLVVQAKGYLVDAPLQPYLLAGVGVIDAEFDDDVGIGLSDDEMATVYKLGGGLEAHSGEHLTFFVESAWTRPSGRIDDFEYVTVLGGIAWRF